MEEDKEAPIEATKEGREKNNKDWSLSASASDHGLVWCSAMAVAVALKDKKERCFRFWTLQHAKVKNLKENRSCGCSCG